MHEGAAAPSYSIRSGGMYAARSGPSGRFFYHFPAVTEGDRKMMQLEKMKFFIFSKGVDFVNTQRFPAYSGNSMVSSTGQWSEPKIS